MSSLSSKVFQSGTGKPGEPPVWRQVVVETPPRLPRRPRRRGEDLLNPPSEEEEELERRFQQARQTAFEEGQASGREQAASELRPVLERLAQSVADLGGLRSRLRHDAEQDLVQLSMAIARRILHRELALDPDALQGVIQVALDRLQSQEISRVRIHPSHQPLLEACLKNCAPSCQVEILPDLSMPPGGVVFETARGNLDASIDTQLREIERGLADRLGKQP